MNIIYLFVYYNNTIVFCKCSFDGILYIQKEIFMFGDKIKTLRQSYNLSQVQLAEQLNVSKQTISNWENNNILPSIEMLVKISQYFSVSTDFLLELDNRKYIEITGLSEVQLAHIQQIIDDILEKKQNSR